MKQSIILAILLFMGLQTKGQSAEQVVLNLSKQKFNWMIQMKYDSLESILHDRLMFVHSNGWVENKEEFIQDIRSGKLRYLNINVKEANVRVLSETAIVTGKGEFSVKLEDSDLSINLFYTEVYILTNGRWLLVSRHANRMP